MFHALIPLAGRPVWTLFFWIRICSGQLDRSYEHFVGRNRELRELHAAVYTDRQTGLIETLHDTGGQGKTALAIQYAHAYGEFHAVGGR